MEIYLDNAATTRCYPEAAALMTRILCEDYGNAASLHKKGVEAEGHIRRARESIATGLKVDEKELIFTSGGTEADNLALIGAATAHARRGRHLITTAIEHPAVTETLQYLTGEGFSVTYLPVDTHGVIDLDELAGVIRADTILISIMHVNNEVGSVQPLAEAGALIDRMNPQTLFHVDAVQGMGKLPLYPKRMGIDLMSVSGHKLHGPKGIGFLYADGRVKINPLCHGGGHQRGLRPGTENVPVIAAVARAFEMTLADMETDAAYMHGLRSHFVAGLRQIPDAVINGPDGADAAPHIISAAFPPVRGEVLVHALAERAIFASTGSACATTKKERPSPTLRAIGLSSEMIASTLRFSLSRFTTKEEIDYTLGVLYDIIPMLRKYVRH